MVALTDDQLQQVMSRIGALEVGSIHVDGVKVDQEYGPDGSAVVVTVVLGSQDDDAEWDSSDFLRLRRSARDVAFEVLVGHELDVVYEAGEPVGVDGDDMRTAGGKHAERDRT